MITNDRQSTPANAAPPSHPAKPTIEAAPQADFGELSRAAGPNIELRPHIGTDGVALAQDRIWLTTERLGPLVVGYVGHTHGQQIALIHRLTDEERLAVQSAVATKFGGWPAKTSTAPMIGDLVDDSEEIQGEDEQQEVDLGDE